MTKKNLGNEMAKSRSMPELFVGSGKFSSKEGNFCNNDLKISLNADVDDTNAATSVSWSTSKSAISPS